MRKLDKVTYFYLYNIAFCLLVSLLNLNNFMIIKVIMWLNIATLIVLLGFQVRKISIITNDKINNKANNK